MLGAPTPEQDKALAQANRTIRGLRDILSKERSRKDELVRLLRKAGVKAPASLESDEEDSILLDEDANASPEQKNRTLRGFPVGRGRGRGGRGMSLAQRLSMVAHRAGSEEPSSDEDIFDEDAEESKASIDSQGLDPTFSKSVHAPLTKSTNQPSPLRQSTLGRSMRGRGRGGGSKRPDSLVGMGIGGDLAKELGMLDEDEPLDDLEEDNDIQVTEVEKIVEVPVEKIVEVPVEKIVEVPVEKIVVKEVIKEVPVEVIKESSAKSSKRMLSRLLV
ncbi:hypothetical protein DL96DRAFT_1042349 [Flagelloscypha sp. PMI_526]|nr:hypothetical protein DL96DRAFT_1042349 [Flagelloscypha sp. PMI_526]